MRLMLFHAFLVTVFLCAGPRLRLAAEPALQPWPENPWSWSDHGKPVLVLGGSDDDNLFQWPEKELIAQPDRLAAAGGNVIHSTKSDPRDKGQQHRDNFLHVRQYLAKAVVIGTWQARDAAVE